MQLQQRRNFFIVFAIFFVICLPFLVVFSLGFSFNIRNPEIKNSLTIKVQSTPSEAIISTFDQPKGKTPIDLSVPESQNVNLKIERKDFVKEQFAVSADAKKNSFVDLSGLWLLPTASENFVDKDSEPIQIVSESLLINKRKEQYFVQSFGLAGYDNEPQIITSEAKISSKPLELPKLNSEVATKIEEKNTYWKKIADQTFYKDNLFLHRRDNFWQIIDLNSVNLKATKVLKLNDKLALLLDAEKKLWLFNVDTQETKFLDKGINAISSLGMSNNIWVWRDRAIHKINPNNFINSNINWNDSVILKNGLVDDEIGGKFDVQNLFQGVAVQVGKYVFYIPDYRDTQWQLLATDVLLIATENETIFWLDQSNNFSTQNMFNGNKRFLMSLQVTPNSFGYIKDWNRIVFYYDSRVDSLWYNKEIPNKGVKSFSFNNWINEQKCFNKVINRVQYCLKENILQVYKNNSLF
jgi:hypothetical protein